ncbi:MAG: SLBB domain-containing protein [Flavobacteriales bacterium]|nr:SLBB domain-containing protein [Flavobacteriales bacterium]
MLGISDKIRVVLLGLFLLFNVKNTMAQTYSDAEIEAAQSALSEAGVDEDELKVRLKAKGIDLDNIRPDQLPSLEREIKATVEEMKAEQETDGLEDEDVNAETKSETLEENDDQTKNKNAQTTKSTTSKGVNTSSKDSIKKVSEAEMQKMSKEAADRIRERIKNGATLDEAIYDQLTEEEQDNYQARSNVYGMDIFFNNSLDFYRNGTPATTPGNYVLDVGDIIAINIFGASQADLVYEIEEDGFIRPSRASRLQKIYLKGLTIDKAKVLLRSRFSQSFMFSDEQFEVSLRTARTITVHIYGDVANPGSYTISALNHGLSALMVSGGPTEEASLRNIRLMSSSGDKTIDVYQFMVDPKKQYDFYLHNNDVIFVPKYQKRVSVNGGGIRRSATYELTEKESFKDVIKWAGGYSSTMYDGLVQHIYKEDGQQKIKDYNLEEIKRINPIPSDGDMFILHSSLKPYENYVNISGAVRFSGNFELKDSMRLSDLLSKAKVEKEAYANMAYLTRKNIDGTYQLKRVYVDDILKNPNSPNNFLLKNEDKVGLYTVAQFTDRYSFRISGAVRNPGEHFWDPSKSITLYDALVMSQGMQNVATDFGYIISSPPNNPYKKEYLVVDLRTAFNNPESAANIVLKPNDQIVVPSMTQYQDQLFVSVSGAVRKPGEFVYDSTLSIKDILVMAGGLKMEAASNKIDIFRLKVENNEPTETYATTIEIDHELNPLQDNINFILKPYDHIVVRTTPDWGPIEFITLKGEVKYPGEYAIMYPNERISSVIERAGGLTKEAFPEAGTYLRTEDNLGNVVTRIDLALKRGNYSKYNLVLKDGDIITIPKIIDHVSISKTGTNAEEIYSENQLKGENLNIVVTYYNRSAKWYVNQFAGGFDKKAKRSKTYVKHANGHIKKTRTFLFLKNYPKVKKGSEVHVVLKDKYLEKDSTKTKNGFDTPKKEKKSAIDRLTELQTMATISTSLMTLTLSTITIIRELKQ